MLGCEGEVVGILKHLVPGGLADAEQLMFGGCFGDKIAAFLVVLKVYRESHELVGRAE